MNLTLNTLRNAIRHNRDSTALTSFRRLTTAEPSVLVARSGDQCFVPLYRVLAEEFEKLPAQTRDTLRNTNIQAAQLALKDAVRNGRWYDVIRVAHRFPGTESAHVAQLILAQTHLDRGNLLAAAHWLHVLQSSSTSPAVEHIQQQLRSRLQLKPAVAQLPANSNLPDPSVSASWKVRWHQRPQVSSALQRGIETAEREAKATVGAASNAEIREKWVYRRTLRGLAASDVDDGEIHWTLRLKPSHLDQFRQSTDRSGANGRMNSALPKQFRQLLIHDGVLNRISIGTDGIYLITASPAPAGAAATQIGQITATPNARLVAVSKLDGRRLWSVGGPGEEGQQDDPLADVWFAGPPLVVGKFLLSVVQCANEIRLITLQADTGELLHSTIIAFPDASIERDSARRLVDAMPVRAGGLLLCTTTTGWLVAVDCLTQSVVWATHTRSVRSEATPALQMNRGRAGNRFSPDQSPGSVIRLLGQTVVVIPWNSGRIQFVDVVSGSKHEHLQPLGRRGLLEVVHDGLIVATMDGRIERVDVSTAKRVWERVLTPEDGLPCGAGIIRENNLLLAMTSGAMISMDVDTGEILASTPDVLRPSRHGMLRDASTGPVGPYARHRGDVLFIGSADTICLTKDPVPAGPTETTELVKLYLAAGRPQSAWDALAQLPTEAFSANGETAALRFDAAFELAADGKLPTHVTLEALAPSRNHRVQAQSLQIAQQSNSDPLAAAIAAIDFLQLETESRPSSRAHSKMLPVKLLPNWQPAAKEAVAEAHQHQSNISLQTLVARLIEYALHTAPLVEGDGFVKRLADLSPEILLQIDHPLVHSAIRHHLTKATQPECLVHLRLHLNAILHDAAARRLTDLPPWLTPADVASTTPAESSRLQFLQMLVAIAEAPSDGHRYPDGSSAEQMAANTQYFGRRRDWWDSWDRDDYLAIPYARPNPAHRHPYRLKVTEPNDHFLRHFDLLIQRTPSRLIVREVAPSGRLIWSVPGSFPVRPGPAIVPTVRRCGSLLLIQSSDAVTAVSLLEQRVLWQARADSGMKRSDEGRSRRTGPRLISCGPRWVCLESQQSIRMLDALTGQSVWSHPVASPQHVSASESCVIVYDDGTNVVTAFDRRSGRRLNHHFDLADVRQIVSTSGADFVMQQPDTEKHGDIRFLWRNAQSGDISKAVNVKNVAHTQRVDASHVATFHTDSRLSVIDLQTADIREYDWSGESKPESSVPPDGTDASGQFDWLPNHIRFFEDSAFVYLIQQDDVPSATSRIPERELTPFRGLRVLDRETGEHLWEEWLPKSRHGMLVTDQLSLPFVATLDLTVPNKIGKRDARVRFRCFRKSDGRPLIEQTLPSRFSYDEFRISAAEDYSVYAAVHGTHVRFERPEAPSVRRPTKATEGLPE